jgi:hypothetical protein
MFAVLQAFIEKVNDGFDPKLRAASQDALAARDAHVGCTVWELPVGRPHLKL